MTDASTTEAARAEEFHVNTDELLAKLKDIVHEGNVRRLLVKDSEGKTLVEVPLNLGVVSVLVAPAWMAVGAVAALAANCTILVERAED